MLELKETPVPDLLLRPYPGRREGPNGYLLRLAEANCLTVADLTQLEIRFDVSSLMQQSLLPDQSLDPDLHAYINHVACLLNTKSRIWNQHHVRFCPNCLQDDPSWRVAWEALFLDVCPAHGCWMVDQCGSCGEPVKWNRDSLLRCQCGSDLRQEISVIAPENARRLSAILEARLLGCDGHGDLDGSDPPLFGLDIEQLQRIVRFFGSYMDPNSGPKPLKLRKAGRMGMSWPVSSLAAEILFQWPSAFHRCLNRLQAAAQGEKTGLHGLFKQAYFYLYRGLREPVFAPIRKSFELWLAENWKGGLAKRNRRLSSELLANAQWIPGSVAADNLEISMARLRYLIREGKVDGEESFSTKGRRFVVVRREQLEQMSALIANEMTMSEAMDILGVGKVRMQRILRLLFPGARRTQDKAYLPWCIPRGEVEGLLAIGNHLPVLSIPDENQVALAYVFKYWNWTAEEIVALVEAVKQGSLKLHALVDTSRGISRWVFEVGQLRAWHRSLDNGRRYNWISIPDVGKILGIKQQVAYWLCQNGFIKAERLGSIKGIGSRVRREHLDHFRENYVFGSEIAEILGRSSRKVMGMLAEQGIYPLRGHSVEPCRQLVYARNDEIQRFLAQATGASPGAFKLVTGLGSTGGH